MGELGHLHDDLSDTASAARCYERALALAPSDDLAWTLAHAYAELDRHQDALRLYQNFKDNPKALESAAILSESLDRHEDLAAAQRNRLEALGKLATAKDFLDLAATHDALEQPDEEIATIEDGLRRFPDSVRLRISLADAAHRRGETEAALRILEKPRLRSRVEALSLYIQIANDLDDPSPAIRFLGENIDEQHQFPLATLVDLSELCVNAGRPYIAERIIEKILRIDPNQRGFDWETLADASARMGNFEMAERFQKRHLASGPAARKTESWEALGDIFDAQGKFREAREAYRRSLNLYKEAILKAEL